MTETTFVMVGMYGNSSEYKKKMLIGAICCGNIEPMARSRWSLAHEYGFPKKRGVIPYQGCISMLAPKKGSKATPANFREIWVEYIHIDILDVTDNYDVDVEI